MGLSLHVEGPGEAEPPPPSLKSDGDPLAWWCSPSQESGRRRSALSARMGAFAPGGLFSSGPVPLQQVLLHPTPWHLCLGRHQSHSKHRVSDGCRVMGCSSQWVQWLPPGTSRPFREGLHRGSRTCPSREQVMRPVMSGWLMAPDWTSLCQGSFTTCCQGRSLQHRWTGKKERRAGWEKPPLPQRRWAGVSPPLHMWGGLRFCVGKK